MMTKMEMKCLAIAIVSCTLSDDKVFFQGSIFGKMKTGFN